MNNKVAYNKNKNKLRNKRNNNVILVWDVKIINVNINIQTKIKIVRSKFQGNNALKMLVHLNTEYKWHVNGEWHVKIKQTALVRNIMNIKNRYLKIKNLNKLINKLINEIMNDENY